MAKQRNDFIYLPLRLTIICMVAAALLALTYSVTKPRIDEQERIAATLARQEVMPSADSFSRVSAGGMLDEFPTVREVYIATSGGQTVGYTVSLVEKGYGGDMSISVGIAGDGAVTGVRIGSNSETAGLGSKATEPAFYSQYDGKSAPLEVKRDIIPISGATRTTEAVTRGVNNASALVERYKHDFTPVPASEEGN